MSTAPRYWSLNMLRVTSCQDPALWYAPLVGQLVPYEADDGQYGFRSREPAGHVNFVRREDAQPTKVRVHSIHRQRWPFNSPGAAAVVHVPRPQCSVTCRHLGVCQGLQHCQQRRDQQALPPAPAPAGRGQSRRHSLAEAAANIAVGFVVSVGITAVVMPAFGHHVTLGQNVAITAIFTVASLVRAYALRRLFNRWTA